MLEKSWGNVASMSGKSGRRCPRCPKNPGRELGLAVQKSLGKSDTIGTASGVHRLGVPASSQPQAGPKIPGTPGGSIRNPPLFHELCLPSKICPKTSAQFLGAMLKRTTCSRRVQVQSSKGPRRVPEGANKGSNVGPSIIQWKSYKPGGFLEGPEWPSKDPLLAPKGISMVPRRAP